MARYETGGSGDDFRSGLGFGLGAGFGSALLFAAPATPHLVGATPGVGIGRGLVGGLGGGWPEPSR